MEKMLRAASARARSRPYMLLIVVPCVLGFAKGQKRQWVGLGLVFEGVMVRLEVLISDAVESSEKGIPSAVVSVAEVRGFGLRSCSLIGVWFVASRVHDALIDAWTIVVDSTRV